MKSRRLYSILSFSIPPMVRGLRKKHCNVCKRAAGWHRMHCWWWKKISAQASHPPQVLMKSIGAHMAILKLPCSQIFPRELNCTGFLRESPADICEGWNVFFHFTCMSRTCCAVSNASDNALQNRRQSEHIKSQIEIDIFNTCLLYTSPSPRDRSLSRMPSSA